MVRKGLHRSAGHQYGISGDRTQSALLAGQCPFNPLRTLPGGGSCALYGFLFRHSEIHLPLAESPKGLDTGVPYICALRLGRRDSLLHPEQRQILGRRRGALFTRQSVLCRSCALVALCAEIPEHCDV